MTDHVYEFGRVVSRTGLIADQARLVWNRDSGLTFSAKGGSGGHMLTAMLLDGGPTAGIGRISHLAEEPDWVCTTADGKTTEVFSVQGDQKSEADSFEISGPAVFAKVRRPASSPYALSAFTAVGLPRLFMTGMELYSFPEHFPIVIKRSDSTTTTGGARLSLSSSPAVNLVLSYSAHQDGMWIELGDAIPHESLRNPHGPLRHFLSFLAGRPLGFHWYDEPDGECFTRFYYGLSRTPQEPRHRIDPPIPLSGFQLEVVLRGACPSQSQTAEFQGLSRRRVRQIPLQLAIDRSLRC